MIVRGYSAGIEENIKVPATIFEKNLESFKEIENARINGVRNLCFVGSSCMYPVEALQPYKESSLGTGAVERSSEPYAYAKLACWQLCRAISSQYGLNFFTAIQADCYGYPDSSHFIGQLIRRFHEAKEEKRDEIIIWGSGNAIREPLFYGDAEKALQFVLENYNGPDAINVGNGKEHSVFQVATFIREVVGFNGSLCFDCSKPTGAERKTLDNSKLLKLGFDKFTEIKEGLEKAYSNFKNSL